MKAKSLFFGFLAGSVIAGAAALLSAPAAGKETRYRLRENKDEITELAKELKEQIMAIKTESVYASKIGKEAIQAFISDVKVMIENWKQETQPNITQLTNRIQEIESSVSELEAVAASSPLLNKKTEEKQE
ncbi:YtxH domain-containing protein [Peribacillus sp. SCS-155]|uniref:YtxH domain-containing protein n=1 Tax=Peribacillus sedimenti TaxID=3115297 RepID=UPI0039063328